MHVPSNGSNWRSRYSTGGQCATADVVPMADYDDDDGDDDIFLHFRDFLFSTKENQIKNIRPGYTKQQ